MSYQVLARRWRPRTFAQMVGQSHVVKPLMNALQSGRLHHAFLFTGTRGVGKTTVARIFAKALNCPHAVAGEPCGRCAICQEIDSGRFVDLLEVDAASRTKVDDTRELLENVHYAPVRGSCKIYLIDEVHMLSRHSFNALLKTLEEPPEHVKFLLATTDPQKLPVTILSRCLQFNLQALTVEEISDQLHYILGQEQIEAESPALWQIAEAADGSLRDALSLLDQAIAFGGGTVQTAAVTQMLGTLSTEQVVAVVTALAAGDGGQIVQQLELVARQGGDLGRFLTDLNRLLQQIAMVQVVPNYRSGRLSEQAILTQLAQQIAPDEIQLYYQIGIHGVRDLPYCPDLRSGVEMTLLRMLAFRPLEGGGAAAPLHTPQAVAPPPRPPSAPAAYQQNPPPPVPPSATHPPPNRAPEAPHREPEPIGAAIGSLAQQWRLWVGQLAQHRYIKPMTLQLAENCQLLQVEEGAVKLHLPEAVVHLIDRKLDLEKGLAQLLKQPELKLSLITNHRHEPDMPLQSPAAIRRGEQQQHQQHAEAAVQEDPMVQRLAEQLGAKVVSGSVKPLTPLSSAANSED